MEPGELDLGTLSLVSTVSPLKLELLSRCFFAPPAQGDFDSLQQLTSKVLQADKDPCPWISRASEFRITFNVTLPVASDEAEQETLLDEIVSRLPRSQMWDQLSLSVASVKTISNEQSRLIQVVTSFAHHEIGPPKSKLIPHKLSAGVSFDAVKPSPGTDTLLLASVRFDMIISLSEQPGRHKLTASPSRSPNIPTMKHELDELPSFCDLHETSLHESCIAMPRDGPEPQETALDTDSVMLDFAESDFLSDELLPQNSDDIDTSIVDRAAHVDQALGSLCQPEIKGDYYLEDIIQLMDSGIRHGISVPSRRTPSRVKITGNRSFHRLAHVVPTLWSPGFLPKIASKAVLLPTISQAIASVGGRTKTAQNLTSKMAELSRRSSSRLTASSQSKGSQGEILESLWHVLQRGTRSEATVALHPLFPTSTEQENIAHIDKTPANPPTETNENEYCIHNFDIKEEDMCVESEEDLLEFMHERDHLYEDDRGMNDEDMDDKRLCDLLDMPRHATTPLEHQLRPAFGQSFEERNVIESEANWVCQNLAMRGSDDEIDQLQDGWSETVVESEAVWAMNRTNKTVMIDTEDILVI